MEYATGLGTITGFFLPNTVLSQPERVWSRQNCVRANHGHRGEATSSLYTTPLDLSNGFQALYAASMYIYEKIFVSFVSDIVSAIRPNVKVSLLLHFYAVIRYAFAFVWLNKNMFASANSASHCSDLPGHQRHNTGPSKGQAKLYLKEASGSTEIRDIEKP